MVEVFKTNVPNHFQATILLDIISKNFPNYITNFDLEDCDNILRSESLNIQVQSSVIINLISESGFEASILNDDLSFSPHKNLESLKSLVF